MTMTSGCTDVVDSTSRPGGLRRSLIRGDGTAVGVWSGLTAVGLSSLAGLAPGKLSALGLSLTSALGVSLALAGVGFWGWQWNRRGYRRLLDEVSARYMDYDPGPSTVAWVSDRIWRLKNRFDPELDAPIELQAELDGMVRRFEDDATGALSFPLLRPVTDEERRRAPLAEVSGEVPIAGAAEELLERLQGTPGRFLILQPRWPVCCDRLTTLVGLGPHDRPVEALYLDEASAPLPEEPNLEEGIHSYQCRSCGRMFASKSAW